MARIAEESVQHGGLLVREQLGEQAAWRCTHEGQSERFRSADDTPSSLQDRVGRRQPHLGGHARAPPSSLQQAGAAGWHQWVQDRYRRPLAFATMPEGEPPPLYKPELIEPKKRLTLLQRCYKEPWVPVGCGTTVVVLSIGLGAFVNGNKVLAQHMMRARVAAQFATIAAMVVAAGGFAMPSKVQE